MSNNVVNNQQMVDGVGQRREYENLTFHAAQAIRSSARQIARMLSEDKLRQVVKAQSEVRELQRALIRAKYQLESLVTDAIASDTAARKRYTESI